jgi:tetratricopeptide (TPR) repeat protein
MKILLLAISAFLFVSCKHQPGKITRPDDYKAFLIDRGSASLEAIDKQLTFWAARLDKDSTDMVARSMSAGLYARRFSYSGDVNELKRAQDWYQQVNKINKFSSSSTFRSLATVCVTQHQFRQARAYLDSAVKMGDDKFRSLLLLSDVLLELGENGPAIKTLDKIKDKNDFEVLIRRAKIQDKVFGKLDNAIVILEQASVKPEAINNPFLFNWIHSNLGDMYGHAGRYKESYAAYLAVLKNDPNYYHCLKGIAWLAFSHDREPARAKEIIHFLKNKQPLPDYDLLLAAIAADEGDTDLESRSLVSYQAKLNSGNYGAMYNAYTCKLFLERLQKNRSALAIAEEEVEHRPTVLSYSLLSWALMENGRKEEALQIARSYVEGRTVEPEAIYRLGLIYSQAGEKEKAKKYLTEASQAGFELGPYSAKQIKKTLEKII